MRTKVVSQEERGDAGEMNRLPWLAIFILVSSVLVGSAPPETAQATGPGVAPAGVTNSAASYLLANYNSTVGLVRNSPDSPSLRNNYYLYSDNFLAALALRNHDPSNSTLVDVSSNITRSIRRYIQGQPNPVNQYEVLTAPIPAFDGSKNFIVYARGLETVNTTVNNQSSTWLDLRDYADIAFLEAVYYYRMGDNPAARNAYEVGAAEYDGVGIKDSVPGNYQTYKLALYIYASRLLDVGYNATAFNQLLAMQANSGVDKGGFYTCYDSHAKAACGTNAETTALALLALSELPTSSLLPFLVGVAVTVIVGASLVIVLIAWTQESGSAACTRLSETRVSVINPSSASAAYLGK